MGPKANLESEGWQKSQMNTAFLQRLLAKTINSHDSDDTHLYVAGAWDDWPLIKNRQISLIALRRVSHIPVYNSVGGRKCEHSQSR